MNNPTPIKPHKDPSKMTSGSWVLLGVLVVCVFAPLGVWLWRLALGA